MSNILLLHTTIAAGVVYKDQRCGVRMECVKVGNNNWSIIPTGVTLRPHFSKDQTTARAAQYSTH